MTEAEVERLMAAAKDNCHDHRDATMALVAYICHRRRDHRIDHSS
jgi:hypothetical protein